MTVVALSRNDRTTLARAEATIRRGLASFVEVGEALATIRDEGLYRIEFDTFEAYCKVKWDLPSTTAYQQIDAAKVSRSLSSNEEKDQLLPRNEAQARALAPLLGDPPALRKAWKQVVAQHGDDVTAAKVRAVVQTVLQPPAPRSRPTLSDDIEREHYDATTGNSMADLRGVLRRTSRYLTNYYETPNRAELEVIAAWLDIQQRKVAATRKRMT